MLTATDFYETMNPSKHKQNLKNSAEDFIEVMPMLYTSAGMAGELKNFYDDVVRCLWKDDIDGLYELSDKALDKNTFSEIYTRILGRDLQQLLSMKDSCRGINLSLNADNLNYVPGILTMFSLDCYMLHIDDSESSELMKSRTTLKIAHSDIYFTYKNKRFCIVSAFDPLTYM